jgi:hypothetical protein
MSRSGTTINFDGIQPNMEASMYSTFRANKSGFLILFYITSNHLYIVVGCCCYCYCCCCSLNVAQYTFYFFRTPSLNIEIILFIIIILPLIIFSLWFLSHNPFLYTYTYSHSIIINIIDTMAMKCRHENLTKCIILFCFISLIFMHT